MALDPNKDVVPDYSPAEVPADRDIPQPAQTPELDTAQED